jgi:hypothetical protein
MFARNLLLALGSLSIVLGLAFGYASLKQPPAAPVEAVVIEKAPQTQVLVAAHPLGRSWCTIRADVSGRLS